MKYKYGVYEIKNSVNGKRYIGRGNLKKRKEKHFHYLRKGIHQNAHLQFAWEKYGENNFKFKVLLYCSLEDSGYYERIVIFGYKTLDNRYGYNLQIPDGETHRQSEETKKKIGNKHRGKKLSDETKRKIGLASGKRKHSPQTIEKLSKLRMGKDNPMFGKHHTEDTKLRISQATLGRKNHFFGRKHSEESKRKMSEAKRKNNSRGVYV